MKKGKVIDSETFQMVLRKVPNRTLIACIKNINNVFSIQKKIIERNPNATNIIKFPKIVADYCPLELKGKENIWLGFVKLYNCIFNENTRKLLTEDEEYLKMKEALNSFLKIETKLSVKTQSVNTKFIFIEKPGFGQQLSLGL